MALLISLFIPWSLGFVVVRRCCSCVSELVSLCALSLVAGLSVFVTVTYVFSALFSLQYAAIFANLVCFVFVLIIRSDHQAEKLCFDPVAGAVALLSFVVIVPLALRILISDHGALFTGHLNCYGDLPFHIGLIQNFAEGQSFPPDNPILTGTYLVYPFLSDFYSAVLIALGMSLDSAVVVPVVVLVPCAFVLLYSLCLALTHSRAASFLACVLFLFGGSTFGFLRLEQFFTDAHVTVRDLLRDKPSYYSGSAGDSWGYYLPNPLLAYFIPQRSFLFGFPLALAILRLFIFHKRTSELVLAGALLGTLPLFHTHSLLAIALPLLVFAYGKKWRALFVFCIAAAPFGAIEILYFFLFSELRNHFSIKIGWMSGELNPLLFWLKNSGLLIPVAIIGLLSFRRSEQVRRLAAIGLFLFLLCNVVQFAQWTWDNTKLLVYAFVFLLPLVGLSLRDLWCRFWLRPLILIFVCIHVASAVVDVVRYSAPSMNRYKLWSGAAVRAALSVKEKTPKKASILSAPIHNSVTLLSGRRMYLGFPGMVWTHGGEYRQRESALSKFYAGKSRVLPGGGVDYVFVGPVERSKNRSIFFDPAWEKVYSDPFYRLYKVR